LDESDNCSAMSELPRNKYVNENFLRDPLNLMLTLATNVMRARDTNNYFNRPLAAVCKRAVYERQRARINCDGS
jgi:hypothetical protein